MPNIRNTISTLIVNKIITENAATGGKSPTAQTMHELATAAILAGQLDPQGNITPQWRAYMVFLLGGEAAADPTDLARLLPEDGTTDDERQKERAYGVGNGMCGTTTGQHVLDGGVTKALDQ